MEYFIADLHIGHRNVLSFDNRPFTNIKDHDRYIMEQWNKRITPDDTVYILGDVSLGGRHETTKYFKQLNGHKHLIIGNHDKKFLDWEPFRECFDSIQHYLEIPYKDGKKIVLQHSPIFAYTNLYRGWIHLYGHVHNSFEWGMYEHHKRMMKELYSKKDDRLPDDIFEAFNVGCMMPYMMYVPRTLEEIITGYKQCQLQNELIAQEVKSIHKTETEILEESNQSTTII